jgi:hypothetical protein
LVRSRHHWLTAKTRCRNDCSASSLGPHHIKQRCYIGARVTQSLGHLGIGDLFNPALDLGDLYRTLRRLRPVAGEQIHEVIDPTCCRFQLVTIEAVSFEVHERIASLRKARTKRSEVSSNRRLLHSS